MRTNIFLLGPVACVLLTMAACSSGTSTVAEPELGANATPAEVNTPADDQPSSTPADTDNDDLARNDEAGTAGATDGTDGTDSTDETDATGETGQTDQATNTPIIDPESSLGQLHNSIEQLVGDTLLTLNQSLNQGEELSTQQEGCLGAFDPAFGEPLLTINCEQALLVNNVPIYASVASFKNTPECVASLQNNNVENCSIEQADIMVRTIWTIPATAPGQPERPQPEAGASIQYGIEQDRLVVESLEQALSGNFRCEIDLTTANSVVNSAGADCDAQFTRIKNLIDEHLTGA